jgi:type IV secretory pathway VirB2 component (pilin)
MDIGSISSSNNNPSQERWFLPSIADLIFIAFLGVLAFTNLSVRLLGDAGIGWHIRTGQLILSTRSIPRVDPFSSSMAGRPWFAWEWLYDVIVGWLDQTAGLNGVVLFTAIVIATTFSWMFRLVFRRKTNLIVALLLLLLAASASMIHFFARPHVVTWLFCVFWLWILDRFEKLQAHEPRLQTRRLLYLLPISMLIWVNVHGGFLVGFVLLAIYWLSAVWEYFRGNENNFDGILAKLRAGKRARDLSGITLLSVAATFVNPYGWRLHLHIYRYLSNGFLMDHIEEFQSPNFHGIAQKCFALLLLITLLALATNKTDANKTRASELLLILFAAYSGLYAARNIPVSSLLLIWVVGPKLSLALTSMVQSVPRKDASRPPDESFLQRMQAIDSSLRGHLWPIAAIVISAWIAFHGAKADGYPALNAHFDARRFPVAAVDYVIEHHLPGPVFAPDSWGGYLIYRLYPQTKVVIDDRHDFYGEQFLKSYLKTIHVEPGWQDFLFAQHPGCILVPKSSALANILLETPSWQPVYTGKTAIVFAPESSTSSASARLQLRSH